MNHDWSEHNWIEEDRLYAPKRKVNNRNSHLHPHIIGSFYSQKLQRVVEYESLGERLFYYCLELDQAVIRYYVQPIEVPMPKSNDIGNEWLHVPDVLVFRTGSIPYLYQIKNDPNDEIDDKLNMINTRCEQYAGKRGWIYFMIYPKTMPQVLSTNIRFLKNYLKVRQYYPQWRDKVLYRLGCMERTSVHLLAESFREQIDPLILKPLIYHLIAIGLFLANVKETIDLHSEVTLNQQMNPMIPEDMEGITYVV